MRFRGNTRHLRRVAGLGYLGIYTPAPSLIKTDTPQQALFFRPTEAMTVWKMCKLAYGKENVFAGIKAVTNSAWNKSHIHYARKGYENYGFDGPQMERRYNPNNPLSKRGSGTAYPTFWIPPLDTLKEPEQIFVVEPPVVPPDIPPIPPDTPPDVIKYYKGDRGDPGPRGPGPTEAEINKAVVNYFKLNPPPAGPPGKMGPPGPAAEVTPDLIRPIVEKYLIENPPAKGPKGDPGEATPEAIKAAVTEYLKTNPPPPGPPGPPGRKGDPGQATAESINKAVIDYFKINPPPAGPPGKMGPPGPAADPELVKKIVMQWLSENPPGIDPAQIKKAVEQYLIANPPETAAFDWDELKKYVQAQLSKVKPILGGMTIWPGLAAFAVMGLLVKGTRK